MTFSTAARLAATPRLHCDFQENELRWHFAYSAFAYDEPYVAYTISFSASFACHADFTTFP